MSGPNSQSSRCGCEYGGQCTRTTVCSVTSVRDDLEASLDVCRDYCRMYLQDEAGGWVHNESQTAAARKMFDALGMKYTAENV